MVGFLNLRRISIGIGTLGGVYAYYHLDKSRNGRAFAAWTTGYSVQKWDTNWDMRAICNSNPKTGSGDNGENGFPKPKAVRNIILIRHGQYNLNGETDKERRLTDLGIKQAIMTGKRLKELDMPYSRIISSTMTRAQETSKYVCESLPDIPIEECSLLEEGAPIPPEPPVGHWKPPSHQFYQDGARIEAAFRKFFYRADAKQDCDSYDIIICHANVIRYFVCRALQYPPEGWLRLSLRHASITWLSITPNGRVTLRCYGDAGYMPPNALTTS